MLSREPACLPVDAQSPSTGMYMTETTACIHDAGVCGLIVYVRYADHEFRC